MRQWLASVAALIAIILCLWIARASAEDFLTIAGASWLVPEIYRRIVRR